MNRDYSDPQYKKWRQSVRQRDNSRCQWPNCESNYKIHAHHIMPWSAFPLLRYDISNGICLCKNHHDLIKNNETSYAPLFFKILKSKLKL